MDKNSFTNFCTGNINPYVYPVISDLLQNALGGVSGFNFESIRIINCLTEWDMLVKHELLLWQQLIWKSILLTRKIYFKRSENRWRIKKEMRHVIMDHHGIVKLHQNFLVAGKLSLGSKTTGNRFVVNKLISAKFATIVGEKYCLKLAPRNNWKQH